MADIRQIQAHPAREWVRPPMRYGGVGQHVNPQALGQVARHGLDAISGAPPPRAGPPPQPNLLDELDQFNQQQMIPGTNIPDEAVSDAMANWMLPTWSRRVPDITVPRASWDFEMLRADPGKPPIDPGMEVPLPGTEEFEMRRVQEGHGVQGSDRPFWELFDMLEDPSVSPRQKQMIMDYYGLRAT